jgi:hypothetical protein
MSPQDLFVGFVAVIFGCLLALGALLDGPRLMSLAKPRLLSERFGRPAARAIIAAIGLALIAMGILIASGWRMRW